MFRALSRTKACDLVLSVGIVVSLSASIESWAFAQAPPESAAKAALKGAKPAVLENRQSGDISEEINTLASNSVRSDPYTVTNEPFTRNLLVTSKLIFPPNSVLLLRPSSGERIVRIVADVIEVARPGGGVITWDRPPPPSELPPDRGRAPAGTFGRSHGSAGGSGLDGEPGNTGLPGRDAPNVVLLTKAINGTNLAVDLRGSAGGPGGRGQDGGPGGRGAPGSSAQSGPFDCSSGPGQGGRGGDGGAAGSGGPGGPGGAGGTLILITPNVSDATDDLLVFSSGGLPGSPGKPGLPGQRGEGGPPGSASGICIGRPDRKGPDGGNGGEPKPAPLGETGRPGAYIVVPISDDLRDKLFPKAQNAVDVPPP